MAERAQITSIEAIESFRSNLILYLSKARPTLAEVTNDVLRMKLWLQNDQRRHWENEMRVRSKKLERAQGELFGARLSQLQEASAAQQMTVRRLQEAVKEVDVKLHHLKRWDQELANRSDPLVKQIDSLQNYLTKEMGRAVAYLDQVIKTLEAYAGVALPASATPPKPDATPNVEEQPAIGEKEKP